jgi:riboflavin biosynthesis pyrimidine reductase
MMKSSCKSMMIYCKACLATSIDGKITAPHRSENERVKLGSPRDLDRLLTLREWADVICFGGSTCREWPVIRWPKGANPDGVDVPPVHLIFTSSWNLPWQADLFQKWQPTWPPIFIASSAVPPDDLPFEIRRNIQWLLLEPTQTPSQQLDYLVKALAPYPSEHWLLEGGGELMYYFLSAQAIQEVHITLTPQLIGGNSTPSLVSGKGFAPEHWPTVTWQDITPIENEIYLTGKVHYPTNNDGA